MTRTDFFGNKSIIANYGPSELFVESFACAGEDSIPLDVTAAEDARILAVDCLRILHTCENTCPFHRQVIYNLMRIMARKNIAFHEKLEITSKRTTRAKLMAYLTLQSRGRRGGSFEIPYNRQELADYLGAERPFRFWRGFFSRRSHLLRRPPAGPLGRAPPPPDLPAGGP